MPGYTLELFYKDGRPDGLVTAEVFGWTGHLLKLPRTRLPEALTRPEAAYTGAYLLLGEDDGKTLLYVGESDGIGSRFRQHEAEKDWWTHAIWITSAANKLNKAHARYLEARLYEEVSKVGQAELRNGQKPTRTSLSEANMESFLAQVLMALPALRVDVFIETARPLLTRPPSPARISEGRFRLVNRKHKLEAFAVVRDGEFIIEAGSDARKAWEGREAVPMASPRLFAELKRAGKLVENGDKCRFVENVAFSSPSSAADIVNGRTSNGTVEWRTVDGDKTYKEWEAAQIGATASPSELGSLSLDNIANGKTI